MKLASHSAGPLSSGDPAPAPRGRPAAAKGKAVLRTVAAKGGTLTLAVHCNAGAPCRGTVNVLSGKRAAGHAKLTLAAGKNARVKVKLSRAIARQLAKAGRLRLTFRIAVGGATTSKTIVVKRR